MSKKLTPKEQSEIDAKRQAAIELARQKVLAAFKNAPENYTEVKPAEAIPRQVDDSEQQKRLEKLEELIRSRVDRRRRAEKTGAKKTSSAAAMKERIKADIESVVKEESTDKFTTKTYEKTLNKTEQTPRISEQEWRKYHSAWQDYYKKYYENYYASLVNKAKIKEEAEQAEKAKKAEKAEKKKKPEEENANVVDELREKIREDASESAAKIRKSRHFIPIIAGLAVVLVFVFLQYNRVFVGAVKAYVMPGSTLTEIVELDPTITVNIGPESKIIIPKINVDSPIIFGAGWDHASQQEAMNHGVVHFSIPGANAMPGQNGNFVVSGHSSGDVFDRGDFKFIFAQLGRIERGDTIYVNYGGVRYVYVATRFEIVQPTDVTSLIYETNKPMLTIITCWPIGTARERLLVVAEQISPNPTGVEPGQEEDFDVQPHEVSMPSSSPTFSQRLWSLIRGNGW